jgi:hypothetical protein
VLPIFLLLACAGPVSAEPLVVDNGRLFVGAKINGVGHEALLDSAAEASLIDPKLAAAAHFPQGKDITVRGSGGEAKAQMVEGVTIEMLGQNVPVEAVVVADLTEISQRLIKRPTQAILGREAFDALRLSIDIQGGTITLAKGLPAGVQLPLTSNAGVESVPVTISGTAAQAEFDLCNGSEPMISRAMVTRLGLKITGKKSGGGIGGEIQRDVVTIPMLEVAGKHFHNVTATIDDQPSANDLNIGTSILRDFLITTDFKQRAVWLAPRGTK